MCSYPLLVALLICGKCFQYWERNEKDALGVGVSPSCFLLAGGRRAGGVILAGLTVASGSVMRCRRQCLRRAGSITVLFGKQSTWDLSSSGTGLGRFCI